MGLYQTMQRSAEYSRLLCEVAPELGLRGILHDCHDASPTPELYRALISTLLRASSPGVADSAYDVLCATSVAPAPAMLGLTLLTSPAVFRAVLHDLVSSLVREEPLDPENPALNFYSNAGVGSSDPEEFDAPPTEGLAVEFGERAPPLAVTRRRSLALTMRYFATVIRQSVQREPLRVGEARLWACLTDDLKLKVRLVNSDTLRAAQEFFGAALSVESEHERGEIISRLVNALQDLAANDPSGLLLYVSTLRDADVKFRTSVLYLQQRFGIAGAAKYTARTVTVSKFVSDFLEAKVVRGRANNVLPPVLTAMAHVWLSEADPDCFKVPANERGKRFMNRLEDSKRILLQKCKPNKRDESEFSLVIMAIGMRVLAVNAPEARSGNGMLGCRPRDNACPVFHFSLKKCRIDHLSEPGRPAKRGRTCSSKSRSGMLSLL